ncbi:MAG: ABC transporter permease [Aggregatilineales bacterium]
MATQTQNLSAGIVQLKNDDMPKRPTFLQRFFRNKRAVIGALLLMIFTIIAIFAPIIAPFEADAQNIVDRLQAPNSVYLMGTDQLGRDIFSRAMFATRISMPIGVFAMLVSVTVGVSVGMISGYFGGISDNVLMRLTDMLLSFPTFFLLLTVTTLFGRTMPVLTLLLGLTSWGVVARVVRSQVLALKEMDFVEAAQSLGASHSEILIRHIFPNILPIIIVDATLRVALVILIEGGLSFLGVGIQPPTPSWGNMVAEGNALLRRAWWVSVFPGAFLFLCTMSFNLVGDGLRDALDPRFKS